MKILYVSFEDTKTGVVTESKHHLSDDQFDAYVTPELVLHSSYSGLVRRVTKKVLGD